MRRTDRIAALSRQDAIAHFVQRRDQIDACVRDLVRAADRAGEPVDPDALLNKSLRLVGLDLDEIIASVRAEDSQ